MTTRITILGSTGSIGRSTLDVVQHYPGRFDVVALAAHSNVDLLAQQIRAFHPAYVAVADEQAAARLKAMKLGVEVLAGIESLNEAAAIPVDITLCAIVGAAGLRPVVSAIDAGNRIAVANKEPLVMAGRLIMERARRRGVEVLPVDSEHNAIFQCLHGHNVSDVFRVHLTASGGPFYGTPRESLRDVPPEQAVKHPTWNMGAKISVDSATLMNKGLEVLEAMWLFDLPLEKIDVVIHPQSIVHSLVEFMDGSILAHLGVTDMKFPILFALTWPERVESAMGRLDLTRMRELTFAAPDFSEFPCLALALHAARLGGTAPAILNAANETAVAAFCAKRIGFLQISEVVEEALMNCDAGQDVDLDTVFAADAHARRKASETMIALGV
ncbi:MAG: 1-deoxy-D-xylulose-5-phosphate reductoisomerase [Candidatus Hydrogenedentes bacterium]|nr:1-deoxy-D-xylulose-5-phosphate reductoisomerase [Candidatus Hydrogenedentota bacterium]